VVQVAVVHLVSVQNEPHYHVSGLENFLWNVPEQTDDVGGTVDQESRVSRLPADPRSPRDAGDGAVLGYSQPTQFA
jgi:hypothetical protein